MWTKLMFTILNGGKSTGSTVKFGKFYMIIDPWEALKSGHKVDIVECFIKFQQAIKKIVSSTKLGVSSFRCSYIYRRQASNQDQKAVTLTHIPTSMSLSSSWRMRLLHQVQTL